VQAQMKSETAALIAAITDHKTKVFGEVFGTLKMFMTQMMKDQQISTPDKVIMKKKKAEWEMAAMEARSRLAIAELNAKTAAIEKQATLSNKENEENNK
jgi:hypothetical protein